MGRRCANRIGVAGTSLLSSGCGEVGFALVVDGDAPAFEVDDLVVVGAQEDEVDQGGDAAVGPVLDVVGFGPFGGPITLGERAALVA